MERNKSAYKLKGIPPVLWINLDGDEERQKHMEDQFADWEITDHTRISGIDARIEGLSHTRRQQLIFLTTMMLCS